MEKVIHFVFKRPVLLIAICLYLSTWMMFSIHLIGSAVLLGGLIYYLYVERFKEGRLYERGIQEQKSKERDLVLASHSENVIEGLKKSLGVTNYESRPNSNGSPTSQ